MSGIEPFQFEQVYQPGEEPPQEESVEQKVEAHEEDNTSRMGNTERCLCGACVLMPVANECYCCQELEELNQKFVNSGLYLLCDYSHEYFVWSGRFFAKSDKRWTIANSILVVIVITITRSDGWKLSKQWGKENVKTFFCKALVAIHNARLKSIAFVTLYPLVL